MTVRKDIKDTDTLVVAFTGYAGKLHLSVEDFFEASGLADASKIIVHDPSYLKTLNGLPPHSSTFAEFLKALSFGVARVPHKKLIMVGTSGGGHSALLYGHLLRAHRAVAFACYPYLSIAQAKMMNDPALKSMERVLQQFDTLPVEAKQYLDLREVLQHWNGVTQYDVHLSKDNEWDSKRARYLAGLSHLQIHEHPYSNHGVASSLAKDSALKQCFE